MVSIHLPFSDEFRAYGIKDIIKQNNMLLVKIVDDITKIPEQDLLIELPQSINRWDKFIEGIESYCLAELTESYKNKAAGETALELISSAIKTIIENDRNLIFPENENESNSSEPQQHESTIEPPFLSLSELVREPSGLYETEGEVISDHESVFHAITSIEYCCSNEKCESAGQSQTKTFDPPIFKLNNISVSCLFCSRSIDSEYIDINMIPKENMVNYTIIKIQDPKAAESTNNSRSMYAIVYNKDIDAITIGDTYKIRGKVSIPTKSNENPLGKINGSNGNLFSILHVKSLTSCTEKSEYDFELTEKDIANVIRWKKICEDVYQKQKRHNKEFDAKFAEALKQDNTLTEKRYSRLTCRHRVEEIPFMKAFVRMLAPKVIGNEDAKLDLILSAVSDTDKESILHVLFVGPPGWVKTTLAKEGRKVAKRNRFVSAETSSMKAIVAITDKAHDIRSVIYGPVVLVRDGIIVIDEIGRIPLDQQSQLLEILDGGTLSLARFGIEKYIKVPCKIIGTSNPYGDRADWSAANTISKDELPLIRPVLDRFPLIRNFNKETDPDKAEEFAREKARRRKLKDGNYQFVVKAVLTMRQLNPSKNIEFSREVDEIIIPQLYRRMITSEKLDASPRVLDNIYKICKAWAKTGSIC